MSNQSIYFIKVFGDSINHTIDFVYQNVFRTNFDFPGFIVLDFGIRINSHQLREFMIELKNELSNHLIKEKQQKLNYHWMGRFDQQESTKFHRDNAANQSFLMLGYEPSKIKSRLFLADYIQFINSTNITEYEYFDKYNPIFTNGEKYIKPYITEIENFDETTYKIVLINNSSMGETLGLLHNVIIINKNLNFERIINSTMFYSAPLNEIESFSLEEQLDFINTKKISKK